MQVVFSGGLMLGSFTNLDRRREEAMRNIQEITRPTLAGELTHAIKQNDYFMSTLGQKKRSYKDYSVKRSRKRRK